MIRWIRWVVAIWATAWLFQVVRRDRARARDRLERISGGYPNEWGVRLTPLSPAETAAALEYERLLARDLTATE
jgi:hypothetical protein